LAQRQRRCRLGGGVLGGVLRQTEVEVGNVPVHPAPAHQSQGAGEGQADATKRRRRESGGLRPVTARSEGRAKPKRDRPPALAAACSRPAHPRQQPRGTSLPRRRRALAPQPPPRWPVRAAACAPGARARALLGCKQSLIARHAGSKNAPASERTILFWLVRCAGSCPAHGRKRGTRGVVRVRGVAACQGRERRPPVLRDACACSAGTRGVRMWRARALVRSARARPPRARSSERSACPMVHGAPGRRAPGGTHVVRRVCPDSRRRW